MSTKKQSGPGEACQQHSLADTATRSDTRSALLERLEDRVLYSADLLAHPSDVDVQSAEHKVERVDRNVFDQSTHQQLRLSANDTGETVSQMATGDSIADSRAGVEMLLSTNASALSSFNTQSNAPGEVQDTQLTHEIVANDLSPVLLLNDGTPGLSSIESDLLQYQEGDGEVAVSKTVVVNDNNISVALVHIFENFNAAQDRLIYTDPGAISGHFDPNTGVLTLTGSGDASAWQTALRSVKYENTSNNPDTADRTIEITINPGLSNSSSIERTVSVSASGPTDASFGVSLNSDGGNNSYFVADDGGALLGGLTQVTAEVTYTLDSYNTRNPLISYYTTETEDTLALVVRDDGVIVAEVMGQFLRTDAQPQVLDGQRHSIAISWESAGGTLRVYVDGELVQSTNNLATGQALTAGGVLVFGLEQDDLGGNFSSNEVFSGTLYDIRVWNEVRTEAEIAASYDHRLHPQSLPASLIANWQADQLTPGPESGIIDLVNGNNISVQHTNAAGFTESEPSGTGVTDDAANGTIVGQLITTQPYGGEDLIRNGGFRTTGDQTSTIYTSGQLVGSDWQVSAGSVSTFPERPDAPGGGMLLSLVGSERGTITQTVNTEPGQTYVLLSALTGNFARTQEYDVGYTIDGVAHSTTINKPDHWAVDNLLWTRNQTTFVATSDVTTISIEALTNDGLNGPWISDIQLLAFDELAAKYLAQHPELNYDPATGKFYQVVTDLSSWVIAQDNAVNNERNGIAGRLVVIRDSYENEIVRSLAESIGLETFIGASDPNDNNEWYWHTGMAPDNLLWTGTETGQPLNGVYTNWDPGEPNDFNGRENYAVMIFDEENGVWNDVRASLDYASIIEWDANAVLSGLTYSIVSDPNGAMSIDSRSGVLSVSDSSAINYQAGGSYGIVVRVTDAVGDYADQVLNIPYVNNGTPELSNIESVNLVYTEGDGRTPLSDTIAIVDSDSPTIESAVISMVNPVSGEDRLRFANYGPFFGAYDSNAGELTITGSASQEEWQLALRSVTYENLSDTPNLSPRAVQFTIDDGTQVSGTASRVIDIIPVVSEAAANGTLVGTLPPATPGFEELINSTLATDSSLTYSTDTNKFYRPVAASMTWPEAHNAAAASLLKATPGRLVSIHSQLENDLVLDLAQSIDTHVWIGASDATTEGHWHWVNDSAGDELFWTGDSGGSAVNNAYTNWRGTEPNNGGNGDYAYLSRNNGDWYDRSGSRDTDGYIIEWDADELFASSYSLDNYGDDTFAIDNNGRITVSNGDALDYETKPVHELTITVTDAEGNTDSVNVTVALLDIDEAPYLSDLESTQLIYHENDGAVIISDFISVTDVDSATLHTATISISGGYVPAEDRLDAGTGHLVSDWDELSGTLLITGSDSISAWQSALRSITYSNTSEQPTTGVRTVTFSVSNDLDNTDTVSRTIVVEPINDSPTLLDGTLTAIPEDAADTAGDTIVNIFSAGFMDIDGTFAAIAITADATTDEGEWQYSTDDGSNWYPLEVRDEAEATVIDVSHRLRFVPASDYHGSVPTLTVYAVDDSYTGTLTDGEDPAFTNVAVRGDSTPYSFDAATIVSTVTPVFDEPVNTGSVPNNAVVVEDAASLVSLDSIVLDARDETGALTLLLSTTTGGELGAADDPALTFSSSAGSLSISGDVDSLNAYLSESNITYLHATPHTNGANADSIDIDLHSSGITTSLGTIDVDILPVNDAPALLNGMLDNIAEDTTQPAGVTVDQIFSGSFTDIDGTFAAIAIIADATTDEGEWQYSTDDGSNWYPLEVRDEAEATVIDVSHRLRFVPASDYHGSVPTLTVYAVDDSYTGTLTDGEDPAFTNVAVRGDSTPYSVDAATIASTVIPVFDAPVNTGSVPNKAVVVEDAASVISLGSLVLDARDETGALTLQLSTTTGGELSAADDPALTFSSSAGSLSISGDVDSLNAYLSVSNVTYLHSTPHTNGANADAIDIELHSSGITTTLGTIDVDILPVNDAPALLNGVLDSIAEDTTQPAGATVEQIFSGSFTDIDGTFAAAAITADATTDEGHWQYSTDGGSNWYPLEVRSESEAIVIASEHHLRFRPAADYDGAIPSLTVYAVDNTYTGGFASNGTAEFTDVTVRGGNTPYSPTPASIISAVTPVYDPPVNIGTLPGSVTVAEDLVSVISLSDFNLDGADSSGPLTLRITTTTGGALSWIDNPGLTFNSASADELAITGDASALTSYIASPSISYLHAIPHTYGQNADILSIAVDHSGGSTHLGSVALHISAINDAPVLLNGQLADVPEDTSEPIGDTIQNLFAGQFTDVDSSFAAIAVTHDPSNEEGQWQYSADDGNSWRPLEIHDSTLAMVIDSSHRLRFVAASDYHGSVPALTVYAVDDTYTGALSDSSEAAHTNITSRGDDTPYSIDSATIVGAITPVFDPPANTGNLPVDANVVEDVASTIDLSGISLDAKDWSGLLSLALSTANGGVISWIEHAALTFVSDGTTLNISGEADTINDYLSVSPINYLHGTSHTSGPGADTISASIGYGGNTVALGAININITAVNDAPASGSQIVHLIEDTPQVLALDDFGFTDIAEGHNLLAVHIIKAPTNGVLTMNGSTVTDGVVLTATDINAGQLIYTPAKDAWGTGYDRLTFTVQDDGGTASGGQDTSTVAGEISFDVAARNDLPTLTVNPLAAIRGLTHTLDQTNIHVYEPDVDSENQSIEVTTVPNKGILTRAGSTLSVGDTFTSADITDGLIQYHHGDEDAASDAIGLVLLDQGPNQTTVSQQSTLTITVQETHPHTEPDMASVDEHQSVVIPVLANDIAADAPLQPNSVVVLQPPLHGTFVVADDGTINYEHDGSETTADSLVYTVSDTDGDTATPGTVSITVNAVSDSPLIVTEADAGSYIHRSPAVPIATTLVIQDIDDDSLQQARIAVKDYQPGVDILGLNTAALPEVDSLAHSWDAEAGIYTISGEASVGVYQSLLRSISYHSDAKPADAATTERSFKISVTDASGTISAAETVSLQLTVPAYPIEVYSSVGQVTYTEDADAVIVDAALIIESLDARNIARATWQITDNYAADQDLLDAISLGTIKSSWNATTGTLELTGEASAADYQAALRSVSYYNSSQDPDTSERTLSLVLESSSGLCDSQQSQLLVTSVNDAPLADDSLVALAADSIVALTDFAFADPADNNALQAVVIETLPASGQLLYNGNPVAAGQSIPAANITAGELSYTPAANTGTASVADHFQYHVQDDGGANNGGLDQSVNAATMTIVVEPVALPSQPAAQNEVIHYQVTENSPSGTVVGQLVDNNPAFTRSSGGDFTVANHTQADINRYAANGEYLGATLGQWQVTDGSVDLHGSHWGRGPGGGVALELNGNNAGTIEQEFETVVGGQYQLTYMLSGNFRDTSAEWLALQVSAGNSSDTVVVNAHSAAVSEWSPQTPQWQLQTLTFTAEDTLTTLQFRSLIPGAAGAMITDVQVRDVLRFEAVPNDGADPVFNVSDNGIISVAERPIDFETLSSQTVEYTVHGTSGTTQNGSVTIDIIDENELPILQTLTPLPVVTGEETVISNAYLAASDADITHRLPEAVTYHLESLPDAGLLMLNQSPLAQGDQFTQADINAGSISYIHNGPAVATDQFSFTLTDGIDFSTELHTLRIDIHEPLTLTGSDEWSLMQHDTLTLNSTHISSNGGLTAAEQLLLVVTQPPATAGFVNQESGAGLDQFMLMDVASGAIALQHNGTETDTDELKLSLYRTDTADPELVETRNIQLRVTNVHNAPTAIDSTVYLEDRSSLTVTEAQIGFSDGADGDELLSMRLIGLPQTGILQLNGITLTADSVVPAAALRDGELLYLPGSATAGTFTDTITFSVIDTGSTDHGGEVESRPQMIQVVVIVPEPVIDTTEPAAASASAAEQGKPIPVPITVLPQYVEPVVAPALPANETPVDVQGLARAQQSQFTFRAEVSTESPETALDNRIPALALFSNMEDTGPGVTGEFRDIVVQHASYRHTTLSTAAVETESSATVAIDDVSLAQIAVHSGSDFPRAVASLLKELNEVRNDVANPNVQVFQIGVLSFSASAAFGVAFWLLRSGIFLGSVLTTVPTLRWLDPLPVLDGQDEESDDEESLQSMVSERQHAPQQTHRDSDSHRN